MGGGAAPRALGLKHAAERHPTVPAEQHRGLQRFLLKWRVLGGQCIEINTITLEMFASDSVSVTSNEGHGFDAFGEKKKNVYRLSGSESDELSGGAAAAESK